MIRKRVLTFSILVLFYTLCFIVLTYPLCLQFSSSFISDGGDASGFVWNIYNFTENIQHLRDPFYTDKLFYPLGHSLILHTYSPIYGIIAFPFENEVLLLNITVYLSFIFSALGAFLLCNHFVRNVVLSALAGFVFAFCPYKLAHLFAHYNLMLTAALPFFVYFFIRSFEVQTNEGKLVLRNKSNLLAACLLLVFTVLSDYYYTLFLIVFAVLYLMYFKASLHSVRLWRAKAPLYIAVIILISNVAVALLAWVQADNKGAFRFSADLLGLTIPSGSSMVFGGEWLQSVHTDVLRANPVENTVFLGYSMLILALCYFIAVKKHNETLEIKVITFLALCYLMLSMPVVHVAGHKLFALPNALAHYIPFINNFRVPSRFVIMVMLFLPIPGFLFVKRRIFTRISRKKQYVLTTLLALTLFVEYAQKPYTVESVSSIPTVFRHLASEQEGTLLEIPFGVRDGFKQIGNEKTQQMLYQTVHHKPILGGFLARIDENVFRYYQNEPIISALFDSQVDRDKPLAPTDDAVIKRFIKKFDLGFIVIYPEYRHTILEQSIRHEFATFIGKEEAIEDFLLISITL